MQTATHMLRTGQRGALFQLQMAQRDLRNSVGRIGLAWSLATHDVKSRYRGSVLGPFWITLSMGLMVLGIGILYASLFNIPLAQFLPYVALGIVFFGVMTGVINEGCEAFVLASGILSQTNLPMLTFVWRTVFRNLINLAHHMVIVVAMLTLYGYWGKADIPLAILGVLLMLMNVSWASLLAGIASARYRDVPQIVVSIMQFAIFMTPVFWLPDRFGKHQVFLDYNPFYHLLHAVRGPMLGQPVSGLTYTVLIAMALVGWTLAFLIFARTRRRLVHYL